MSLDRIMLDARRDLVEEVERLPIPEPPVTATANPRRPRWTVGAVVVTTAALIALGLILPRDQASESISAAPVGAHPDAIVPFDQTNVWQYSVVSASGSSEVDFEIRTEDHAITADGAGRTLWPTALLEPWRWPAACTDQEPLRLPDLDDLAITSSTSQEIRATCDGVEVVGAARLRWSSGTTRRTVAAGTFHAAIVDVSITGFGDPFPLELRYWIDPAVGIIAIEAEGAAPGPERSIVAELAEIS